MVLSAKSKLLLTYTAISPHAIIAQESESTDIYFKALKKDSDIQSQDDESSNINSACVIWHLNGALVASSLHIVDSEATKTPSTRNRSSFGIPRKSTSLSP
jgi:hypothetical protein